MAAQTAVDWSKAQDNGGPGLVLRTKHAVFDKLVYHQLRAALGGNCRASISGGAPLGAVDEDGFLTITGRKKEIIVTAGGKSVAPAVLEDQLRSHPLISQVLVVGDAIYAKD